jgi:hypothetical protein
MNINMNDLPENNDAIQAGRRFFGKIKSLSSSGNLLVEDLGL